MLAGSLTEGFTGGWLTGGMAANSIVSEASTEATRTTRISMMEGADAAGLAITLSAGGIIYDHTNYYVVFSISLIFITSAIVSGKRASLNTDYYSRLCIAL